MGEQPRMMVMVDESRLNAMEAQLRNLCRLLEASNIKPKDEWLTAAQAAEQLGVSTQTIWRKATSGEIEAKGTGKARRYRL
ncbi:helix-turn-helix domain-containing protein [Thioclava sp. GXIMD4215]|uniref:helix-turn-helix domain-containing protein n=1 Tax=Thioclava sp. GXIMD4215 TaxID=3131928 RepID=UPI00325435B8